MDDNYRMLGCCATTDPMMADVARTDSMILVKDILQVKQQVADDHCVDVVLVQDSRNVGSSPRSPGRPDAGTILTIKVMFVLKFNPLVTH